MQEGQRDVVSYPLEGLLAVSPPDKRYQVRLEGRGSEPWKEAAVGGSGSARGGGSGWQ